MTIKELRDFNHENYYSRIGFTNKNVRKKRPATIRNQYN